MVAGLGAFRHSLSVFHAWLGSKRVIEDRSAAEGFSRRVADAPEGTNDFVAFTPRWSPDGTRFLFSQAPERRGN